MNLILSHKGNILLITVNSQSYLLSPNDIHLKRSSSKLTTTK